MKFLVVALSFFYFSANGQTLIFSKPMEKNSITFQAFPNATNPFFGIYQNDTIACYSYSNKNQLNEQFSFVLEKDNQLERMVVSKNNYYQLGSLKLNEESYTTCFYSKNKNEQIFFMTVDSKNKSLLFNDTITLEKDEKLCAYYVTDTSYIFISYFTKSDNIVIYQKKNNSKTTYHSYLVEHENLGKRKNERRDYYVSTLSRTNKMKNISSLLSRKFSVIIPSFRYSLSKMLEPTKLYFQDNKFILTYNNESLETFVFKFPLSDTTIEFSRYKHLVDSGKKVKEMSSICTSTLIDSTLILGNINNEVFHLTFLNTNTDSLIKGYRFDGKDTMIFAKNSIKKNGNFWSGNKKLEISTKRMLERLSFFDESFMGIAAYKTNDTLYTRIGGSYVRIDAVGMAAEMALFALPLVTGSTIAGFYFSTMQDYSEKNLIYFDAGFNTNNFSTSDIDIYNNKTVKLTEFLKNNKLETKFLKLVFQNASNSMFGYLIKDSNLLNIYKFD